jgi:hypothetical protein
MSEPTPGDQEQQESPQPAPQPAPQAMAQPAPAATSSGWRGRLHRLRGTRLRLTSVLAAVGFLLLGGVGGFGLAQAVDDSGHGHRHGPGHGMWQDGGRFRDGGPGQGPQGPQGPRWQVPRGGGGPDGR